MKHFVVYETFCSAGDKVDVLYVVQAQDSDDAYDKWRDKRSVESGEIEFESNEGNIYKYDGCKEVSISEYSVLSRHVSAMS